MADAPANSRSRLLGATIDLVRANGYAATRVEDVCVAAGVTKGSFFHHFASKEALAIAAAGLWDHNASRLFAQAPYHTATDPLDRLLGYLQLRKQLLAGEMWQYSCYAGTIIQETHQTYPQIRAACAQSIVNHLAMLRTLIEDAQRAYPKAKLRADTLAVHIQAVIQGAFIMAKAQQDTQAALHSVDHLQRYIEMLFAYVPKKKRPR